MTAAGEPKRPSPLLLALLTFSTVLFLALGGYALFSLKYFYVTVQGDSMEPEYSSGDRVIFKKVQAPQAGDVVIFTLPEGWEKEWLGRAHPRFIKRLAAVPGDTVSWNGRGWSVNGEPHSALGTGTCEVAPQKVRLEAGEYFVAGDTTTGATLDSREAFCKGLPFLVREVDVEAIGRPVRVF